MKIVLAQSSDWQGLYINGELVIQNHNIGKHQLAKAIIQRLPRLNISYETVDVDEDWINNRGYLPQQLEKVKLENE